MAKNRTATTIALFLLLTMTISLLLMPIANAHDPPWQIPTTAYMNIAPNPVGVGQSVFVVVWLDRTMTGTSVASDIRLKNYKLTITKPDGTTDSYVWETVTDTTSSAYTAYVPTQTGNYTFKFDFPGQVYTWNRTTSERTWTNDYFMPSSRTLTLKVQEEQIPPPKTSYPLPTEYWTRPIEGENTDWWTTASNWRGGGSPDLTGYLRKIQPDGIAPNSAHIMWSKPIQDGGVVGGSNIGIEGQTFYPGLTYNRRFGSEIIMFGRLFYTEPYGNSGSGGDYVAVDLRTGKELWRINTTGIGTPSFGYYYAFDSPNQHGVLPAGLLFTSNFARAYDPITGRVTTLNVTNVPSGTAVLGPKGEHLRYVWNYAGRWLAEWNSSKVVGYEQGTGVGGWYSGTVNASLASRYDWNVSIPDLPGLANPSILAANYGDMIFGRSSSIIGSIAPSSWGTPNPYTFWAISLKPGQQGQLLWIKNYTAPPGNVTLLQGTVDFESRIFTTYIKESMQWYGYNLDNGNPVWGPTPRPLSDFDYYEPETTGVSAFGRLFYSNYGGICYCYDMKTGELLWTYGNGGEGNTTDTGFGTAWGRWPIQPEILADGKIYLTSTEHSPNNPLYKDARLICLNVSTGEELWAVKDYGGTYGGFAPQAAIADGYLVTLNQYDYQIYCYGKGPSSLTVTAPDVGIELGKSIIIRGTVSDVAAGTKQNEQAARFPNGVPAMSDESMNAWMEYVYMQKPRPQEATGVTVKIEVIDANNNLRTVGTTASDASGMFTFAWKPDIEGEYKVIAKFTGSESYWPSFAETSFVVDPAPPAVAEPEPEPAPMTDTYVLGIGVAIIIAVAVVGALIMLMLRKRP